MSRPNRGHKRRERTARNWRKAALVAGLSVLFYMLLGFFLGEKGLLRYAKLHHQRDALKAEITALKGKNDELSKKVDALKTDPDCIEGLAREQGMVKDGEIVYQYEDNK